MENDIIFFIALIASDIVADFCALKTFKERIVVGYDILFLGLLVMSVVNDLELIDSIAYVLGYTVCDFVYYVIKKHMSAVQ